MWNLAVLLLAGTCVLTLAQVESPVDIGADDLLAESSNTYQTAAKPSYEQPKQEYSSSTAAPSYAKSQSYDQATQSSATYEKRVATYAGYSYGKPAPSFNSSYNPYTSYSPWRSHPGSYTKESYGGARYLDKKYHYSAQSVYSSYLTSGSYQSYSKHCSRSYGQAPKISYSDLNAAFSHALQQLNQYNSYEKQQYQAGNYMNVSVYSSGARHQIGTYMHQQSAPSYLKEKEALFMEFASKYLMQNNCLGKLDAHYLLPQVKTGPKTGNPYGDKSCYAAYGVKGAKKLSCGDSKYRSVDGSCNNLYHPYWGKASVCHLRLLPPAYEDGIQKPRVAHSGYELPNARRISATAHFSRPDRSYYTHLKMMWGQYVNHDITFTPTSHANYEGGLIKCCPTSHHPQCMPIQIPAGDYQSKYKKTCMNFVRSAPCPLCTMGPRQQQNMATSYIDNGACYGNTKTDARRLRTHYKGLLRTQMDKCGSEILPATPSPWEGQCTSYPGMSCFDSGDQRVNQHPGLQMLHTLQVRAHNKHARALAHVNPKWGDEKLYQEARRISIAQLQHITYHEYLPILFGPTLMKYYDLESYGYGYSRYEPYTDPTTWNDYSTAACRFGHSQISSFFSLIGYGAAKNGSQPGFWLKDWFFDPKLLYECNLDHIIKGFLHDHSEVVDPWITGDVHNYLYRTRNEPVGSDLPAFNIQRGRDHGIPPYHAYLKFCFGFVANSWEDIGKFVPYEQLYILKNIYKDWRDIDYWVGGISERKFPDADVGPTFACVLGIQYYHVKFGDRHFYSHGHQTGSFTPKQLASIKQVTSLSGFLCHTADRLDAIQKNAFFPAANYNPVMPCKSQPHIDYTLWKDGY